jgi:hypothetical protein
MPSYTQWTDDEVALLSKLFRMDMSVEEISRVLDRSPRAVEHALKNVLVQELVHTNPRRVAAKYGLTKDVLYHDIAPAKYYQEDPKSAFLIVLAVIVLYVLIVGVGLMVTKE